MSANKEAKLAAREFDRADDLVDTLQATKQRLQRELDEVNAQLDAAKADRDQKKDNLKAKVANLS